LHKRGIKGRLSFHSLSLQEREEVILTTTTVDFQKTHKLRISTEPKKP
jgi:hypothetical protein